jgi:hypothetical protein
MQDVETGPDPCRDTHGAPNQCLIAGGSADGDHDALGCLPADRRLLPAEMVDKLLVGLIGEEPKSKFHERNQVLGAEKAGERLRDSLGR